MAAGIVILGATGSIGLSTLDVLSRHPNRFTVIALTANQDVAEMLKQCLVWKPRYAVMADEEAARQLQQELARTAVKSEVLSGVDNLERVASCPEANYVMAAIVGAAGLLPTLAAANSGKRVLLANKESLVMSGDLLLSAVRSQSAELLPIDSEHNAIFQCFPDGYRVGTKQTDITRIILTASGGPFRDMPLAEMAHATPEEACNHPNWRMGRKISVDSATMMNKGLEVIEACYLYGVEPDQVDVVIHPQSIVHSLVEYRDGSVLAQLGNPDMRTPIAHALSWPEERISSGVSPLALTTIGRLDFSSPDTARFPCLRLAIEAFYLGGTATSILNAANEVAVTAFLEKQIAFSDIAHIVEATLDGVEQHPADSLEAILQDDERARQYASQQARAC